MEKCRPFRRNVCVCVCMKRTTARPRFATYIYLRSVYLGGKCARLKYTNLCMDGCGGQRRKKHTLFSAEFVIAS